ncbi:hypothetical protein IE077_003871, partial [Cardiosporidium cionae]
IIKESHTLEEKIKPYEKMHSFSRKLKAKLERDANTWMLIKELQANHTVKDIIPEHASEPLFLLELVNLYSHRGDIGKAENSLTADGELLPMAASERLLLHVNEDSLPFRGLFYILCSMCQNEEAEITLLETATFPGSSFSLSLDMKRWYSSENTSSNQKKICFHLRLDSIEQKYSLSIPSSHDPLLSLGNIAISLSPLKFPASSSPLFPEEGHRILVFLSMQSNQQSLQPSTYLSSLDTFPLHPINRNETMGIYLLWTLGRFLVPSWLEEAVKKLSIDQELKGNCPFSVCTSSVLLGMEREDEISLKEVFSPPLRRKDSQMRLIYAWEGLWAFQSDIEEECSMDTFLTFLRNFDFSEFLRFPTQDYLTSKECSLPPYFKKKFTPQNFSFHLVQWNMQSLLSWMNEEISSDKSLGFTLKLVDITGKEKEQWAMTDEERLYSIQRFKNQGNRLLKKNWMALAQNQYEHAYNISRFMTSWQPSSSPSAPLLEKDGEPTDELPLPSTLSTTKRIFPSYQHVLDVQTEEDVCLQKFLCICHCIYTSPPHDLFEKFRYLCCFFYAYSLFLFPPPSSPSEENGKGVAYGASKTRI